MMDERVGRVVRLKQLVAKCNDIKTLYELIQGDAFLLEQIDDVPFFDTPLHKAASTKNIPLAMEMMRLKPSFARKPNPEGFGPFYLALRNEDTEMVRRLLQIDGNLVRVKGKEGITALHYAAENGKLDLLSEFRTVCPDSIEDVTIKNETALHIALKCNNIGDFEVLVGWLQKDWSKDAISRERTVLNWKDEEGNTVLHVAVSNNQTQAVRLLLNCGVDINAVDMLRGQTQAVNREIRDMLWSAGALSPSFHPAATSCVDYLRSAVTPIDKMITFHRRQHTKITDDMRNALLVVAVLIVAVTYQAALSPPGGVWQDDSNPITIDNQFNTTASTSSFITSPQGPRPHKAGTLVMGTLNAAIFVLANSVTFYLSIAIIFFLIPIDPTSGMVSVTLLYLSICYSASMASISTSLVTGLSAILPITVVAQFFVFYDCYGACQRALEICKRFLCKCQRALEICKRFLCKTARKVKCYMGFAD